jgi:hypothetical protein
MYGLVNMNRFNFIFIVLTYKNDKDLNDFKQSLVNISGILTF